jgi:hypothetical protein
MDVGITEIQSCFFRDQYFITMHWKSYHSSIALEPLAPGILEPFVDHFSIPTLAATPA